MLKGILDENEINLLAIRHTNALNKFGKSLDFINKDDFTVAT